MLTGAWVVLFLPRSLALYQTGSRTSGVVSCLTAVAFEHSTAFHQCGLLFHIVDDIPGQD